MTQVSNSAKPLFNVHLNTPPSGEVLFHALRTVDGKIVDFSLVMLNAPAGVLWGFPEQALVGRSVGQLLTEPDRQFLIQQFSLVVSSGRAVRFAMEFAGAPNQPVLSYDMLVTKLEDGVLVSYSQTSEPGPASPGLSQQDELFRKLVYDSNCMIEVLEAVPDADGEIVDFVYQMVNYAGLSRMGLAEEQVVGQRIRTLFPDIASSDVFANLVAVAKTGETRQQESCHTSRSGETTWIASTYVRYNQYVIARSLDMTRARLAEQKYQQQADLYRTILDTALTAIAVLDAVRDEHGRIIDLRYTMVNQERLRLAGKPASFFVGNLLTELYPGMVESGLFARWVEVIETRQPRQFEVNYAYDGFDDWSLCLGIPFGDDSIVVSHTDITKQKQDELQAHKQAELLNSIQNTSQMGISACKAIRDEAGIIIDFQPVFRNEAAARMHSRPQASTAASTLCQQMPHLKSSGLFERYARVVDTRQPEQFEQYYSNDGIDGWFEMSVQPWDDGFVLNVIDTSKFRRAEREKIQQGIILQQVIDNTQAGMVLARPVRDTSGTIVDFRYILTNEFNARITGRPVARMADALVGDLFPGWQESNLFRQYVEVVETGQPLRLTFPYESYGMKGWFDGSFSCVDGCILYTYTEVTPLKEAELEQQRYASLLEQVMNMMPAAIVVNESIRNEAGDITDLRMVRLNPRAAEMMKYPIDRIQFRRVSKFIPGSLDTELFAQCRRVIETGKPARLEVPWADRWYDFSLARFGDGLILTVHDITPMREYQQRLEQANVELKRSNENLQSFAFVSSHDLQEPLRKIISFADILTTQYDGQFEPTAADVIRRISASAKRMRLLIQDLLAYSQVDTRLDLVEPVAIAQLIGELQEHELWMTIQQTNARIHVGELPVLVADRLQMRQLFQNLLSNAIKFCPEGTTPMITVSSRLVRETDPSAQSIASRLEKGWLPGQVFAEISVADNGIGFDEKYLDRIFQVFQRLHGRSQYAGSGIGLAICYKIVERHGGAITASSQPGQGSTFRVYLPVR